MSTEHQQATQPQGWTIPKAMPKMWWTCPNCKETLAAPANQSASNVVGCERCKLEMRWGDVQEKW